MDLCENVAFLFPLFVLFWKKNISYFLFFLQHSEWNTCIAFITVTRFRLDLDNSNRSNSSCTLLSSGSSWLRSRSKVSVFPSTALIFCDVHKSAATIPVQRYNSSVWLQSWTLHFTDNDIWKILFLLLIGEKTHWNFGIQFVFGLSTRVSWLSQCLW